MAKQDRRVEWTIAARDEASAIFKKIGGSMEELRQQMNLPIVGPLSKDQQRSQDAAMDRRVIEGLVERRAQEMERAAVRSGIQERVQEALFGVPKGPLRTVRRSADDQLFRDMKASRIRDMREAARVENAAFKVDVSLYGEAEAKARAMERLAKAGGKAKQEMTGILGVINKFGTSSGLDSLVEKLSQIAPKVGLVLAAVKAGAIAFSAGNFIRDYNRHRASGNLERQLADEQKANEFADNISLGFGPAFKEFFNIGGFRDDKIAIENLEDQTKAQEAYTARLKARYAIEKSLTDNARSANFAMNLQFAQRGTSAERAGFLGSQAALDEFNRMLVGKGFSPTGIGGIGTVASLSTRKANGDLEEQQTNLQRGAFVALKDSAVADLRRARDLLSTLGGRLVDIVKGDFDKTKDVLGYIRQTNGIVDVNGLLAQGKSLEADLLRLQNQRDAELAGTGNAGQRASILRRYDSLQGVARRDAFDAAHEKALQVDQQRYDINQKLMAARQQELSLAASLGDQSAERAAKEAEITADVTRRRRELLAIVQDEGATGAQKAEAFKAAFALNGEGALRRQLLNVPIGGARTAPSEMSPFVTGAGMAATERSIGPEIARAIKDAQKKAAEDISKAVSDAIRDTWDAITRRGANIFLGGALKQSS